VATLVDDNDPAEAKQNVLDLLSTGQAPDGIVALYGYSGPAVVEALDEAGVADEVTVIGFDYADETIRAIEEGKMFASIAQDPYNYGFHAVRILSEELSAKAYGAIPINNIIDIRCFTITEDNLERFKAKLEARRAGGAKAAG
jgi:ribose transport system substrate-binding protein